MSGFLSSSLLRVLDERLSSGRQPPLSGSLFQWVVGVVGTGGVPGANLNDFPVLESQELTLFHGLRLVPLAIVVDWPVDGQ